MSEIVPVTREEKLVDAIIDSEVIADKGVTRAEKYLEHIMNGTTATEEPVTRAEHYLAKIAGMDVQLEEPVTRVEIFLAAIAGMTVDPPAPVTRLEKLLAEWVEAAAGELKTVTGAVVAVSDALARKAEDLTVAINPVQSGTGTPSPDNVRPISGHSSLNVWRTGVNLLNPAPGRASSSGLTFSVSNGVLLINGTNSESAYSGGGITKDNARYSLPAGTYTLSFVSPPTADYNSYLNFEMFNVETGVRTQKVIYGINTTPVSFTLTNGVVFDWWVCAGASTYTNFECKFQLELGSTATAYTPYVGDTYDVQFGEAGTVYGGQLDVTTGVLTVNMATVDLGTLTWGSWLETGTYIFHAVVDGNKQTRASTLICSQYKPNYSVSIWGDLVDCEITGANGNPRVYIRDQRFTDNVAFTTAMSGVQLVYELATPITYQLTPTEITMLLGDNNVWSDTGDSTLKYWAEV